ncbi:hypothetical protein HPB50_007899 [Hyalomma asiaticum]|uniref:Uncharacterized protein n=1 Tax=Hyalomma asiaticum TaxID=266040 RepID=A0ACB7TEA2_HYAAI|nr:hypothetical protein HPB50_007899 [Hyalomma asiaticum]
MSVIDVFEYVHSYDYFHADAQASILLLGFGKGKENEVRLVQFALSCLYTQNGKQKEYKEALRKTHDGTIEFTRQDAHIGDNSKWRHRNPGTQPPADNLKVPEHVSQQKSSLMENISLLIITCFPRWEIPCGITEFVHCVAAMKFEDTPDYKRLQRFLEKGIQAAGFNPDGRLPFTPPRTQRRNSFSPKKPVLHEIIPAEGSTGDSGVENAVRKPPHSNASRGGRTVLVRKKNCRSHATTKSASGVDGLVKLERQRKPVKKNAVWAVSAGTSSQDSRKNGLCEGSNSVGLGNPTPTMLEVLQRKEVLVAQQKEGLLPLTGNGRKCSSNSPSSRHFPSPLW